MTTSGSTDFNLVSNELIEEAFSICGIAQEGEAVTADMYQRGRRSANLLIKSWGAKPHLWIKTEGSVTMVAGQVDYAFGTLSPKPMRIHSVRRKVTASGYETPLMEWSRQEYFDMPNKSAQSIPTAFYYDPQTTTGTLYIWAAPSTATASDMTLRLTYSRRMEDFDGSADDADIPQEWLQAFTYALASELALKYGVTPDIRQEITARAQMYEQALANFDDEPASLYLSMAHR